MDLKNLFESMLLEKVYGAYAVVYHRTKVEDLANKVYTSGFKPGKGDMYGKGFYSTYELESQMRPEMSSTYGDVVVKFAVPTTNLIFFDYEPFTKSPIAKKIVDYNKYNFVFKQLSYFKMEYNKRMLEKKLKYSKLSSEIALNCYKYIPDFTKKCDGIVFTGSRDGKVLVCYNTRSIIPLSYKKDGDTEFTKITDKNLDYLKTAWKEKNRPEGEREYTPETLGITNYKINSDGTMDVQGDVNLSEQGLKKLPYKFGKVTGNFDCSINQLTSLEGAPKWVGKSFNCRSNNLTSLEGAPKVVKSSFNCSFNNLTSLEGCPESIGRNFQCTNNNLTSLKGSPETIRGYFNCSYNELTSLEGAPKTIKKYFECWDNKLISLEGSLKSVGEHFDISFQKGGKKFTEDEVRAMIDVEGIVRVWK